MLESHKCQLIIFCYFSFLPIIEIIFSPYTQNETIHLFAKIDQNHVLFALVMRYRFSPHDGESSHSRRNEKKDRKPMGLAQIDSLCSKTCMTGSLKNKCRPAFYKNSFKRILQSEQRNI